jgi:hypothetical protein
MNARTSHQGRRPEWVRRLERRGRPPTTPEERAEIRATVLGNLTDRWFTTEPEITIDDFEILVVGEVDASELANLPENERGVAESARLERFREDTRARRMEIAQSLEQRFERKVSWGAVAGSSRALFTTVAAPVMTRLQQPQRAVLDTLVDAGVARSRSEALAWCVELVAEHEQDWIEQLRTALRVVEEARSQGPARS